MFSVGEKVVYPVHGAGVIEAVENREILGETRSYYVLRLSAGDMHVLVPVDSVDKAGLRPVCCASQLEEVRAILTDDSSPWEDNWNRRYRQNMEKIKSGDICQIAEVVRNLTRRDLARGLSAGEKKMLDNARRIFLSEVVLAAALPMEEASRLLDGYFK